MLLKSKFGCVRAWLPGCLIAMAPVLSTASASSQPEPPAAPPTAHPGPETEPSAGERHFDHTTPTPDVPTPASVAIGDRLHLGDPAPDLGPLTWLRGQEIEHLEPGRVYVVGFWVPGWPASREGGGVFRRLEAALGDSASLVYIAWRDDAAGVTPESAWEFIDAQGSAMDCRLAFDDTAETYGAYMESAGVSTAPHAFVIDQQGAIAWHGSPLDGQLPAVIDLVLKGEWDIAEYKRISELEARGSDLLNRALTAWNDGRREECVGLLQEGFDLDHARFARYAVWKFHALHAEMGESARAYEYARDLINAPLADDADALSNLAWVILEAPPERTYDDITAEMAARRALEITGEQHGHAWAAVAMIEFRRQNFEDALAAWERALSFVPSDDLETVYLRKQKETREAYEQALRDATGGP